VLRVDKGLQCKSRPQYTVSRVCEHIGTINCLVETAMRCRVHLKHCWQALERGPAPAYR
jgi:hypothetical protein